MEAAILLKVVVLQLSNNIDIQLDILIIKIFYRTNTLPLKFQRILKYVLVDTVRRNGSTWTIPGQIQSPCGILARICTLPYLKLKPRELRRRADWMGLMMCSGVPSRLQPQNWFPVHISPGWEPIQWVHIDAFYSSSTGLEFPFLYTNTAEDRLMYVNESNSSVYCELWSEFSVPTCSFLIPEEFYYVLNTLTWKLLHYYYIISFICLLKE